MVEFTNNDEARKYLSGIFKGKISSDLYVMMAKRHLDPQRLTGTYVVYDDVDVVDVYSANSMMRHGWEQVTDIIRFAEAYARLHPDQVPQEDTTHKSHKWNMYETGHDRNEIFHRNKAPRRRRLANCR